MNEVVGECESGLARHRDPSSSKLGNFVTDMVREAAKADVGVYNKSGIRANIDPGKVTMRTLHNVEPFGNHIKVVELTGAQLQAAFEYSASKGVTQLEASGVSVVVDPKQPVGKRVKSIKVGKKKLNPKAKYTVAAPNFIADGGDGHRTFTKGTPKPPKDKIMVRDAFKSWFVANKKCRVDNSKRIDVAK